MTKIINFFGGPGAGKSTIAAQVFSALKEKGVSCEILREFATELSWAKRIDDLRDQNYVFAEQNHRQLLINGKVDYIITDSPIIISSVYRKVHDIKYLENTHFDKFAMDVFNTYDNVNFLIKRNSKDNFSTAGRVQNNIDEAKIIDDLMLELLTKNNIQYKEVARGDIEFVLKNI